LLKVANPKFEDAMARLEEIVNGLEKGDLSLDKSLKMFEEGVRLSKSCLKMLDEAQQKVEILVRDKEGKKKVQPFQLEDRAPPGDSGAPPGDTEEFQGNPPSVGGNKRSSTGNMGTDSTLPFEDEEENG
jgi:exodeoxyribonuclease VII small subunit